MFGLKEDEGVIIADRSANRSTTDGRQATDERMHPRKRDLILEGR